MVVSVTPFLIIVADDIEQIRETDGIGHRDRCERGRDWARLIQRLYGGDQWRGAFHHVLSRWICREIVLAERRIGKGIIPSVNLVADAPQDDARMIAVPANHVRNIRHRPLIKTFAVPIMACCAETPLHHPFMLPRRKFVKCFVHHDEAHPIAQVQKFRVRRIVAGANRVDADFFQQTQTPFQNFLWHGRAKWTRVVMNANPLELGRNAVESKSFVGVKRRGADAKGRFDFINHSVAGFDMTSYSVKLRRLERPQLRLWNCYCLNQSLNRVAGSGIGRGGCRDNCSIRPDNIRPQREVFSIGNSVFNPRLDADKRGLLFYFRRRHRRSPMRDVQWFRDDEPHVPINSRACIETRISVTRMIHAHGDDVVRMPVQIRRQLVFKSDVTVWPLANKLAVDPDFAMVIHAVEFNRHQFVFQYRVELEVFAIPADAAGHEAIAAAIFRVQRAFNAPIVRQV